MRLFILGATGQTGLLLVEQALQLGHTVTAYVRNPSALMKWQNQIHLVQGELEDSAKMTSALAGQDAVLFALGVRMGVPDLICSAATKTLLPAMKSQNLEKIVVISGLGVEASQHLLKGASRIALAVLKRLDQHAFEDKELQEKLLRDSQTQWTLVRAPWLTNGALSGKYQHGLELPVNLWSRISRADLAHFMLIECLKTQYQQKCPIVRY